MATGDEAKKSPCQDAKLPSPRRACNHHRGNQVSFRSRDSHHFQELKLPMMPGPIDLELLLPSFKNMFPPLLRNEESATGT